MDLGCVRHNNAPLKKMSYPNPGTSEYVSLHGKKNLGDMIQLRIFRWEDGWV